MKKAILIILAVLMCAALYGRSQEKHVTFDVANTATNSDTLSVDSHWEPIGVFVSAGFTDTLYVHVWNGTAYVRMDKDGADYVIECDATNASYVPLNPDDFLGVHNMFFVAADAAGAAEEIKVKFKRQ